MDRPIVATVYQNSLRYSEFRFSETDFLPHVQMKKNNMADAWKKYKQTMKEKNKAKKVSSSGNLGSFGENI